MKRYFSFILVLVILLTLNAGCTKGGKISQKKNSDKAKPNNDIQFEDVTKDTSQNNSKISFTTGKEYNGSNNKLFAVMIENTPQARPQSGLIDADVVYEALTEGGITRFMALYFENYPKMVGPVRSARPYYVYLAKEWNAQYIHVGGSNTANKLIKEIGLIDIDAMHGSRPFFVDPSRKSPHATYASLVDATKMNDLTTDREAHFAFANDTTAGTVKSVEVKYNRYYDNLYKYDDASGHFLRYINGKPHLDRETGKQVYADNIIVQFANQKNIGNTLLLQIDLIGSGKAMYVINRNLINGVWKRDSVNSKTKFYDENGQEIKLMPGKTWISIVSPSVNPVVN